MSFTFNSNNLSIHNSSRGVPLIGIKHLGHIFVRGLNLSPYPPDSSKAFRDTMSFAKLHNHISPIAKCDEIIFSVMGLSLANINLIVLTLLIIINILFIVRHDKI